MRAIRAIWLILLLIVGLIAASVIVAVSAFLGLLVHLALFGIPILLATVLAVRDLAAYAKWKNRTKK